MREKTFPAVLENIPQVTAWVDETLEQTVGVVRHGLGIRRLRGQSRFQGTAQSQERSTKE